MKYSKLAVADVDGDHFDDLVAIGVDGGEAVIDVYLNVGKTKTSSEDVNFYSPFRITLKTHIDADASTAKTQFSPGYDLQVVDLDNDGHPDLLVSSASTGEIFILWNQPMTSFPTVPFFTDRGPFAWKPYGFIPDTDDPTAASMTIRSPLAQKLSDKDGVFGTPIYVTAADLGDASGYKSIVAYHGALQPAPNADATSKFHYSPFNTHNYEALAILHFSGKHTLDRTEQREAWPSCDLSFGSACAGWSDGMPPAPSESDFLSNFRVSNENGRGASLAFADVAADILQADDLLNIGTPRQTYSPATYRPNASPGLQVMKGRGPGGSDSIWLQGGGKMHEFVADNRLMLMRRQTAIDTVIGNERSAGATFGTLSTGATPLITAGGMRVVYDPSDLTSTVDQSVPAYLNREGQIGAWLNWAALDSGPALLSLSDYCRAPDPCASQFYWPHKPLDGSAPPKVIFGGSSTLVMLDFAREKSVASGKQFEPFFQAPDETHFQAFTIRGGPVDHKPFVATGHFGSPTESSIVMLDHTDGDSTDATWNHLKLYRPDSAKTYVSPTPHLDGLTVGRYIEDGLADVGNTLPQGELSAVLVGSHLGTDTADGIRYVTVHDKATGTIKGIFPASAAETVKELGKDGVVVPGLSTLGVGTYTLEVHNATAMASMNLTVVNPFGITTTDFDWRAGSACGFLPNTKDADLWPKQVAVAVTSFPDSVQAVRWMNQDDGTVVNLGADGATYDAKTALVSLFVPQGKLKDGHWRVTIKAGDVWLPIKRNWNVAHDTATLASCAQQLTIVNEEAYSQCKDGYYFLAPAQYSEWPHLATGSFRFFGSGFQANHVKSATIKQGNHRYPSVSLTLVDDREAHVEFGDLSTELVAGVATSLYFYSEDGDVVAANGVPAVGGRAWRTPMAGGCTQAPPNFDSITGGSGKDGAYQAGDVVTATGENLMSPVPTAVRLFLTDKDTGAQYALPSHLPDDVYETHYDNAHGKLLFAIPEDDAWDQYLVTPPTHLTGLPALQVAYSAQAGLTTISEFTLSKLTVPGMLGWAFAEGIYISGNTPTGVLNFLKKSIASNPNQEPGVPGDDQPRKSSGLWLAQYISNTGDGEDPNVYAIVFTASENNWLSQMRSAIYAQGRGAYPNSSTIATWPCNGATYGMPTYACVVYAAPVTATNAEGIPYRYVMSDWNLINIAYGFPTGSNERVFSGESSDSSRAANSWLPVPSMEDQFFWRISTPAGYQWIWRRTLERATTTGPDNNCAYYWILLDNLCYQANSSP